jgi:hypothetical protein
MAITKKVLVTHPISGNQRKFDKEIYNSFRAAILHSLKRSRGKPFTQLTADVSDYIRSKMPGFKGSVSWYTISVKLDLEAQGKVESFIEKGTKLNRLKR